MSRLALLLIACLAMAGFARAEVTSRMMGGDLYLSGTGASGNLSASRDVFAAGPSLSLRGQVAGVTHAAGFDVEVDGASAGSIYAVGATVAIRATTGHDLSAMAFSLRTLPSAVTQGNARLAGGMVTIEGPVSGSLGVSGGEVVLDSVIGGDVWIIAEKVSFGAGARIGGNLIYSAPSEVSIPEGVIPTDRVRFTKLERSEMLRDMRTAMRERDYPVLPAFMTLFTMALVTLAFLVALGAVLLAFFASRVEHLRTIAAARPGFTILMGFLGLATVLGSVPVSAMTLIGIPLVPVAVLFCVVVWTLGYLMGVYVVALRFWQGMGGDPSPGTAVRVAVLAAGLVVMTVLNFIPFLGWFANMVLVLLGTGAVATAITLFLAARAQTGATAPE